jgi:hypothetical protein
MYKTAIVLKITLNDSIKSKSFNIKKIENIKSTLVYNDISENNGSPSIGVIVELLGLISNNPI